MPAKIIPYKELTHNFNYNPDTGIFTWAFPGVNRVLNKPLGYIDRNGYKVIALKSIKFMAHRAAWVYVTGANPPDDIDHINHIRTDNRFSNLRLATRSDNMKNSKLRKDNATGVTGVAPHKPSGGYRVKIRSLNKYYHIGLYQDYFEAICARKSAELTYNFHRNHGR